LWAFFDSNLRPPRPTSVQIWAGSSLDYDTKCYIKEQGADSSVGLVFRSSTRLWRPRVRRPGTCAEVHWSSLGDDRPTLPKKGATQVWHIAGFVIDS